MSNEKTITFLRTELAMIQSKAVELMRKNKELKEDRDELVRCATNLLTLKKHKLKNGKDSYYTKMKPIAWGQLQAALSNEVTGE